MSQFEEKNSQSEFSIKIAILDIILLISSFYVCGYAFRGTITLPSGYQALLYIFVSCWLISSLISKKFNLASYKNFWSGMIIITRSFLYLSYCVAFTIVIFGFNQFSRLQIFGTCTLLWFTEMFFWGVGYLGYRRQRLVQESRIDGCFSKLKLRSVSYSLTISDACLVPVSFFCVNYVKRGDFHLLPEYDKLLLIIIGIWFASSFPSMKFKTKEHQDFYFSLWQWLKSGGLMLAFMSLIVYVFRLFHYSRFQAFGTIGLLICFELVILRMYFWLQNGKEIQQDIETVSDVKTILDQEELPLNVDIEMIRKKLLAPAVEKLREWLLPEKSELLNFVEANVNVEDVVCAEVAIEQRVKAFGFDSDRIPARIFINLHKVNDIRRLNQFFLQVHQMLLPGGYFISWAHTLRTHEEWIYKKFPRQIANVFFLIDFFVHRVMPKIPWIKKVYFSMTKGRGRVLSRAEVLGRLCFCGFEIVAEKDIDMRFCFIARKVKTPSIDQSPTYGPIVTLERIGFRKKAIHVYKLRTMHPYSEYLQKYVYDMNGLKDGGKLEQDFRTTSWGRFMRRCWLDELPMIYNWLKGDLQLVGVRPLSPHYLSLYDKELKELRAQVKPGILPPFYYDLPSNLEEICLSEKRYIESFLKSPVKTQWCYFWKILINIVFKGARSN